MILYLLAIIILNLSLHFSYSYFHTSFKPFGKIKIYSKLIPDEIDEDSRALLLNSISDVSIVSSEENDEETGDKKPKRIKKEKVYRDFNNMIFIF